MYEHGWNKLNVIFNTKGVKIYVNFNQNTGHLLGNVIFFIFLKIFFTLILNGFSM